jgi:hypothetical protein
LAISETMTETTAGVAETIAAFQAAGLALFNDAILATTIASLLLRVAGQFTEACKLGKMHQNVFVFVKGDARKATAACGTAPSSSRCRRASRRRRRRMDRDDGWLVVEGDGGEQITVPVHIIGQTRTHYRVMVLQDFVLPRRHCPAGAVVLKAAVTRAKADALPS